jgi:hypothetical protein
MKIPASCLILFVLTVIPRILHGQFTDSYASTEAGQYVEALSKHLNQAEFNDDFKRDADYLAQTFSRTDRLNIPPELVIKHIRLAQSVRSKFYPFIPSRAYQEYLLALRIRYERTPHSNWRQVLHEKLSPLTKDITDIDLAANRVFLWIHENVQLENEGDTYPVGFKGDLDPLTTLRGKAGTEIDIAILGVAALRSVGIASRIVMAPAIANEKGGKVWLEYRSKDGWIPWVPSNLTDANHMVWLKKQFGKNFTIVVTNSKNPTNITPRYCGVISMWICPDPPTIENPTDIVALGENKLLPLMGKDLSNQLPENMDYGLAPQFYMITSGIRDKLIGYKYTINNSLNETSWYTFSLTKKQQYFENSNNKPSFFPWTETYARKYQDDW